MKVFENGVRRNTFTPTGTEDIVRLTTSWPIRQVKRIVRIGGGIACRFFVRTPEGEGNLKTYE
jgi:hypothetical protein